MERARVADCAPKRGIAAVSVRNSVLNGVAVTRTDFVLLWWPGQESNLRPSR